MDSKKQPLLPYQGVVLGQDLDLSKVSHDENPAVAVLLMAS